MTTLLTCLGIDERFAIDESAGRRYFLTDALGSTLALTDSSGTTQQTYAYEPYGEVSATGSSTNPYQSAPDVKTTGLGCTTTGLGTTAPASSDSYPKTRWG